MWLVVGLGNPGDQYANTRHNVGFMVVDAFAQQHHANFQKGFQGRYAKCTAGSESLILLKPETFMNRSGASVQEAAGFFHIEPSHIIVVHDDLDVPAGRVRLKSGGGHGGHNGLRDIIQHLGPDYLRVRAGIGRPEFKGTEVDFVLAPYPKDFKAQLESQIATACQAIESLITDGLQKTQLKFHS